VNELAAAAATVSEANDNAKKRRREDKEESDRIKAQKKEEDKAKFLEEQQGLMPSLSLLVGPHIEDPSQLTVDTFTGEQLKQLAKHCFESAPKSFTTLRKSEKCEEVKAMIEDAHTAAPAAGAPAPAPEQFGKQQSI